MQCGPERRGIAQDARIRRLAHHFLQGRASYFPTVVVPKVAWLQRRAEGLPHRRQLGFVPDQEQSAVGAVPNKSQQVLQEVPCLPTVSQHGRLVHNEDAPLDFVFALDAFVPALRGPHGEVEHAVQGVGSALELALKDLSGATRRRRQHGL